MVQNFNSNINVTPTAPFKVTFGEMPEFQKRYFDAQRESLMRMPERYDDALKHSKDSKPSFNKFNNHNTVAYDFNFMQQLRKYRIQTHQEGNQEQQEGNENKSQSKVMRGEPSFYQKDVQKYFKRFNKPNLLASKNKKKVLEIDSITTLSQNHYQKSGKNQLTKSINFGKKTKGNEISNIIDIDYCGNVNEIAHLLRPQTRGTQQIGQIQFETGLRNYDSKTSFQAERPWDNGSALKRYLNDSNSYVNSQSKLGSNSKLSKSMEMVSSKYVDKFRDRNANNIRHILADSKITLQEIQWESHLRNYKGDFRNPSKEEFFQYLPEHVQQKQGYSKSSTKLKKMPFLSRDTTKTYLA